MRIFFEAEPFDKITKDSSAKFTDMLAAIGGTMGLLTGFSIINYEWNRSTIFWVQNNPQLSKGQHEMKRGQKSLRGMIKLHLSIKIQILIK